MARNKQTGPEVKLYQIDTMVYLGKKNIISKLSMFAEFLNEGGVKLADRIGLNRARALERYDKNYKITDIQDLSIDGQANETWLRKNGLLNSFNGNYDLSQLATSIINKDISLAEYCFLILSKQWIKVRELGGKDEYKENLLSLVLENFIALSSIPSDNFVKFFGEKVLTSYKDEYEGLSLSNQESARFIIEPLLISGLIEESNGMYILSASFFDLAKDYVSNSHLIRKIDEVACPEEEYWNSFQYGFYDLISDANRAIYSSKYPHLLSLKSIFKKEEKLSLQLIVYGAPGTGKSYGIEQDIARYHMKDVRTTFHPDSDYSTFVGAYKPQMERSAVKQVILDYDSLVDKFKEYIAQKGNMTVASTMIGHDYHDSIVEMQPQHTIADLVADAYKSNTTYDSVVRGGMAVYESSPQRKPEKKIVYKYSKQAFLKSYVEAWKDIKNPHVLVIEEMNRGNCAQIFGDIFQLLDRNDAGFSRYPIDADADVMQELNDEFEGLKIENAEDINNLYKEDIIDGIISGEKLVLPNNLYIWATMNTSDQSLFPIDSAFKRRWSQRYVPIRDAGMGWVISVNGKEYDWWSFVSLINNKIWDATHSEDKKLGYFFCQANTEGVISAKDFVGKVIFFIYNDVFKDNDFDDKLFVDETDAENPDLLFKDFFMPDGNPNEKKLDVFMQNLGVAPKKLPNEDEETQEGQVDAEETSIESVNGTTAKSLKVAFEDETIEDDTIIATYIHTLRKIGLHKVEEIAAEKTYQRFDCPLVSKERLEPIESDTTFSWEPVDGYFVMKGMNTKSMIRFLNLLSERLNLNLNIEY